eukprot:3925904-Pleurochrysis_carterae.AAC.1
MQQSMRYGSILLVRCFDAALCAFHISQSHARPAAGLGCESVCNNDCFNDCSGHGARAVSTFASPVRRLFRNRQLSLHAALSQNRSRLAPP